MERGEMKYIVKTISCILSGVKSVQERETQTTWCDMEPEYADYYSCFLFNNGRHIPVPLMFNIYYRWWDVIKGIMRKNYITIESIQEFVIFLLSRFLRMRKIREMMDKMDQETIVLAC